MATASLQQDIGDQETISSWKRDFGPNRWQLDDCSSACSYLGSTAVRGCVDERDQRDGKEGEQHDCYRPGTEVFEDMIFGALRVPS